MVIEMLKRRKRLWIGLVVAGVAVAIVIGILIYADFSYSFFVVPLVVDERSGVKSGLGWMLLERMKQIIP